MSTVMLCAPEIDTALLVQCLPDSEQPQPGMSSYSKWYRVQLNINYVRFEDWNYDITKRTPDYHISLPPRNDYPKTWPILMDQHLTCM